VDPDARRILSQEPVHRFARGAMSVIASPELQRLYDDWDARRGNRELPSRDDFDPLELTYILGRLNLVDALYDPVRFRYRVFGGDIAKRFGFEMTGRIVDDYFAPEYRAMVQRRYTDAVAARRPIAARFSRRSIDQRQYYYESLVLPLSRDGSTIDMLMAGFAFRDRAPFEEANASHPAFTIIDGRST
jgi:hypothetical protein